MNGQIGRHGRRNKNANTNTLFSRVYIKSKNIRQNISCSEISCNALDENAYLGLCKVFRKFVISQELENENKGNKANKLKIHDFFYATFQ